MVQLLVAGDDDDLPILLRHRLKSLRFLLVKVRWCYWEVGEMGAEALYRRRILRQSLFVVTFLAVWEYSATNSANDVVVDHDVILPASLQFLFYHSCSHSRLVG
jgi:hypothetical protein